MTDDATGEQPGIPLQTLLGLRLEEHGDGARATMPLTNETRELAGAAHGGILAVLADVACAAALEEMYDDETSVAVSTDLYLRYFAQPKETPLIAEARIVHNGARILSVECVIHDGGGRQVARATQTYMILERFDDA